MSILAEKYSISHIVFYDSSFSMDPKRVEAICRTILDRSLKVSWRARIRPGSLTESLAKLMRKAGCIALGIGVESGSQRLLDVLEKSCTLAEIEDTFQITKDAGIWTVGYFMLGIPGETKEDSYNTIEFAKKLDPDWALFSIATPLPGTKLFEITKDNVITRDWSKYRFSANSPVLSYDQMTEKDLSNLMDYAFSSFYLRKEWLTNRLNKVSDPEQKDKIIDSLFFYLDKRLRK
jgi:radical SAM superfamily enzyme YgiQ (UPF0313 family)